MKRHLQDWTRFNLNEGYRHRGGYDHTQDLEGHLDKAGSWTFGLVIEYDADPLFDEVASIFLMEAMKRDLNLSIDWNSPAGGTPEFTLNGKLGDCIAAVQDSFGLPQFGEIGINTVDGIIEEFMAQHP